MMKTTKKMVTALLSMALAVTGCSAVTLENAGKEVQDTLGDLTDSNNKYVLMVKGLYNENCPDLTNEQAFSDFFQTPQWCYFSINDGQNVVAFTGDCTFRDAAAKVLINQWLVAHPNGVEWDGEYEPNATYESYRYNLYINESFYDMILVDESTGELSISEEKHNESIEQ